MSTIKLTAEEASRAITLTPKAGFARVWDDEALQYRLLTRNEFARGERYLRRKTARLAARIRHTSNVRTMHAVARASGLGS